MYGSGCYGSFVYGGLAGLNKEDTQFELTPSILGIKSDDYLTINKKEIKPLIKSDVDDVNIDRIIDLNKPTIWQHNNKEI